VVPFNSFESRPPWQRLILLVACEAAAGISLYAIFTFMPFAVQLLVVVVVWVIITNNFLDPSYTKSLGSLLWAITAMPTTFCYVRWRMTHQDSWSRLAIVGACLMAALIFVDRWQNSE
jgi:hypothetical protein